MAVYLQDDEQLFTEGVNLRRHRYKLASSLHSQFDTIGERTNDEHAIARSAPGTTAETTLALLDMVATAQVRQGTAGASVVMSADDARRAT